MIPAMTDAPTTSPEDVVAFWRDAGPRRWFAKDDAFDADFKHRFAAAHEAAAAGAFDGWTATANGSLALLILLDQFPRNAFRDTARMFATDAKARGIADAAIAAGHDRAVDAEMRRFFYLPFMHSETLAEQERSVKLCSALDPETLRFAVLHRDIIARFGRFPHRNPMLGRSTSAEEQQFLDQGGFKG